MTMPESAIRVAVDPTNPGQFFACCGLLELADRLWPGAEGWFEKGEFRIAFSEEKGTLRELLALLSSAQIKSSLGDDGLKRLGTLLSANKSKLTATDIADKERLRAAWQVERVHLTGRFDLWLDWWWDEKSGATLLKTWAAKQFVLSIARPMLDAIKKLKWDDASLPSCLNRTAKLDGLPFYFDAANNSQGTPRDTGFAPASVKTAANDRPLLELLAFVGIQRFRPFRPEKSEVVRYSPWTTALTPAVAGAVASGLLHLPSDPTFEFRMLYRTEYMKAFLPAQSLKGDFR